MKICTKCGEVGRTWDEIEHLSSCDNFIFQNDETELAEIKAKGKCPICEKYGDLDTHGLDWICKECRGVVKRKGSESKTFNGSVKIMRSYDYCHFEIALSSTEEQNLEQIDEMRKEAARLVDKAVDQFIIHTEFLKWRNRFTEYEIQQLRKKVQAIKENYPISEWTPEQKAEVKKLNDIDYWANRDYDYDEDWNDDYPEW